MLPSRISQDIDKRKWPTSENGRFLYKKHRIFREILKKITHIWEKNVGNFILVDVNDTKLLYIPYIPETKLECASNFFPQNSILNICIYGNSPCNFRECVLLFFEYLANQ